MFYCTQLWWSYSNECLRKIRVAFNNSFRFLMGYSRRCSASGMSIENNYLIFSEENICFVLYVDYRSAITHYV